MMQHPRCHRGSRGPYGPPVDSGGLALEGVQLGAALEREGSSLRAATPVSWRVQEKQALLCKAP